MLLKKIVHRVLLEKIKMILLDLCWPVNFLHRQQILVLRRLSTVACCDV